MKGWDRRALKPEAAGQVLRDVGFDRAIDDPEAAHGHFDRQGRLRRVHARYRGGWRVTLKIKADGSGDVSWVRKVKVVRIEVGG